MLGSKVDANNPVGYYVTQTTYTKENRFDQFSILTNSKPKPTTHRVIVPEYVNLTYDLIVWTDFVEHMNGLLESILYSEGSFWGDKERFKFRTKVDNITTTTDLQSDNDRLVRSTFSMTVFGYIVPDVIQKAETFVGKFSDRNKLIITSELVTNINDLKNNPNL